jgi:hypothetical protein
MGMGTARRYGRPTKSNFDRVHAHIFCTSALRGDLMKAASSLAFTVLLFACSSSQPAAAPGTETELRLIAVGPSSEVLNMRGPVSLQYELEVTNPTNDPLLLRRLDLQTIGTGAYSIRSGAQNVNQRIAPAGTTTVRISVWGQARGGSIGSTEPVTIRGTAWFEAPDRKFQKVFIQNLSIMN